MELRYINLDASNWKNALAFYNAVLAALGSPEWHGTGVNALADSMIWSEEINSVTPPYILEVLNSAGASLEVKNELSAVRDWLAKSRREFRKRNGYDVEVGSRFYDADHQNA